MGASRWLPLLVLAAALVGACDAFVHRSRGEQLWRQYCAECHGLDAAGNTVQFMGNSWADLRDDQWKSGGDPESIEQVIREGVFAQMPPHDDLSAADMKALIDWLYKLRGENE